MKNTIKYYYDMTPDKIYQKDEVYKFSVNNQFYQLLPFDRNIDDIINIYYYLIQNKIYCHEIIYNRNNEVITKINNKNFVLIKIYIRNENLIDIKKLLSYNIQIPSNKICDWYRLWCAKIDFYEDYLAQNKMKHHIINSSINYYIGLTETAICLVRIINTSNVKMYINHERLSVNSTLVNLYNPLNLVIDVKIRDICEYFKSVFFYKNEKLLYIIEKYLLNEYLTNEEAILFISRMIYPSYYFDLVDMILEGREVENKLNFFIEKIDAYELFLSKVILIVKKRFNIPEIEWLKKRS